MTKKGKTIQKQSPENYIRSRARGLEIYECVIEEDWDQDGYSNLIIARRHSTGKITAAVYLVDLYCLGITNSDYLFNVDEEEYREEMVNHFLPDGYIEIDYTLAHNIIFAAIDYAEEFGFKPHRIFTNITQYLLKEDNEEIELIDIECGLDGKPTYLYTPLDTEFTLNRIRKQLEKTAGPGNFEIINASDYFDKYEEEGGIEQEEDLELEKDFEDGKDIENAGGKMDFEKAIEVFREFQGYEDELNKVESILYKYSIDLILLVKRDDKLYEKYYNMFFQDLDIEIAFGLFPLHTKEHDFSQMEIMRLQEILIPILNFPEKETKYALKQIADLRVKYYNHPFFAYLELYFASDKQSKELEQKVKQYEKEFTEYALIKLMSVVVTCMHHPELFTNKELLPMKLFFPDKEVFPIELEQYLVYTVYLLSCTDDINKLIAFCDVLTDGNLPKNMTNHILHRLMIRKAVLADAVLKAQGR